MEIVCLLQIYGGLLLNNTTQHKTDYFGLNDDFDPRESNIKQICASVGCCGSACVKTLKMVQSKAWIFVTHS